jgi:hypothetical protein
MYKMDWMIEDDALHLLEPLMPATELNYFFNNPNTFEIGAGRLMPDAVQTIDFQDYSVEENDIANHRYAGAALYDLENWSFSPLIQQENPASYQQIAAQEAQTAGLTAIESPALDLLSVDGKGAEPYWKQYLQDGFAADAARYSNVYEIQAQSLELSPSKYISFVTEAAEQARAANPHVEIIAGLSTYSANGSVTGAELYQDAMGVASSVNGFWLNIPGVSAYSPGVTRADPTVAAAFLNEIYHNGI